jgi:hypothetical protein
MTLSTLNAKRVKTKYGFKTELYLDGKLKATVPDYQKQPHGNCKKIMLNCFWWKLKFIKND